MKRKLTDLQFTPGPGKGLASPPVTRPQSSHQPPQTDGAQDVDSISASEQSSGTGSPVPQFDGAKDKAPQASAVSHFVSRTSSPGPFTGQDIGAARPASPGAFGYPYYNHRDRYLSDTPTPTAIHG